MSNEEVTNMLVSWLETSYRLGQRLSGIVYVHNISKPRVQGSAFQNMRMFRTMCGSDALRNVTFATSFWDIVDVDTAEARERELAESGDLWANMVRRGAQVVRLGTDRASALEVLERFADSKAKGLSVQREMVLQRKEFEDTTAGRSTEVGIAIALEKDFEKDKQALKQHIDAKQAQRDQKYTSAIENLKYDSTQLSQQAQSTLESAKEENRRVLREEARNQSSQRKEVRQQVKTLQAQQEGVTAKYEAARRENKAQEKRDKKEKERLNQEVKKIKSEKRKVEANVAEQTYYEPVYQNYYRGRY
ncbi:hypothetical protein CC86DRAFT_370818 [Ophiobolus disseminans]|uniref:Uncharacterized protein n=1 Tax=Ophiobolus disseminans TaxID=1469910 RepID=A0A6A6ZY58_9PLEO|nr:hypothetical protein CC86DRAFT_370818 [Ophiobolus disseminans]